jgi:DNA polymerase III subunit epsilon
MKLVAIDFETADRSADSACAIGIVSIEKGKIIKKEYRLIRPPRRNFIFFYINSISWTDVEAQPTFGEVWDYFAPFWNNADYFLAHNALFDRKVLMACCSATGRGAPTVPFICTVRVARSHSNFRPTNLPTVCTQLGISLKHHDEARLLNSLSRSWGTPRRSDHITRRGGARTVAGRQRWHRRAASISAYFILKARDGPQSAIRLITL